MARTDIEAELDDIIHGHGMEYGPMDTYAERITRFLDKHIVIPRSEPGAGEIIEESTPNGITVKAGSGPESVYEFLHVNPNWLRNKALNLLNVADYIENRDAILAAKVAETIVARDKRRDELVDEMAPRIPGMGPNWYSNVSVGLQRAVDRIIEMEDARK